MVVFNINKKFFSNFEKTNLLKDLIKKIYNNLNVINIIFYLKKILVSNYLL